MLRYHKYVLSLKHLSLLYLVIFKPSCNNLISTIILVLYASYVCFMHSRFIENHSIDLEAMNTSFLRWFCHTTDGDDPRNWSMISRTMDLADPSEGTLV
jgi:hypothetical protein